MFSSENLQQQNVFGTKNPEHAFEENKNQIGSLVKGMKQLDFKNQVVNLECKNVSWDSLNVPNSIQTGLFDLAYLRPSIIQGVSIPKVMKDTSQNFLFQAINGSGKTGAFAIPSLLKIDTSIDEIQVIILANTRELIRQIYQVMQVMARKTDIKI